MSAMPMRRQCVACGVFGDHEKGEDERLHCVACGHPLGSPTGRLTRDEPEMQNLTGTPAHKLEMAMARGMTADRAAFWNTIGFAPREIAAILVELGIVKTGADGRMVDIDLEALEREIADMTEDGKAFTRQLAGALAQTIYAKHGKPQAQ